jgi:hypothetical protein
MVATDVGLDFGWIFLFNDNGDKGIVSRGSHGLLN